MLQQMNLKVKVKRLGDQVGRELFGRGDLARFQSKDIDKYAPLALVKRIFRIGRGDLLDELVRSNVARLSQHCDVFVAPAFVIAALGLEAADGVPGNVGDVFAVTFFGIFLGTVGFDRVDIVETVGVFRGEQAYDMRQSGKHFFTWLSIGDIPIGEFFELHLPLTVFHCRQYGELVGDYYKGNDC